MSQFDDLRTYDHIATNPLGEFCTVCYRPANYGCVDLARGRREFPSGVFHGARIRWAMSRSLDRMAEGAR